MRRVAAHVSLGCCRKEYVLTCGLPWPSDDSIDLAMPKLFGSLSIVGVALALQIGCSTTNYNAHYASPNQSSVNGSSAQFLKCHMYDGSLLVLATWKSSPEQGVVTGIGPFYDPARNMLSNGPQVVRLADVELLETNDPESVTHGGLILMGVVSLAFRSR